MGNKVGLGEIVDAKINESKQLCSLGKFYPPVNLFRQNDFTLAEDQALPDQRRRPLRNQAATQVRDPQLV